MRAHAGDSGQPLATVPRGELLYVTDEQRSLDGAVWRYVMHAAGYRNWPAPPPSALTGWVAVSSAGGDSVELEPVVCPVGEPSLGEVIAMTDWAKLACFGGRELTLEGFVVMGFGGMSPGTYEPGWLAHPMGFLGAIRTDEGNGALTYRLEDRLSHPSLMEGQRLAVTGHFSDPASAECTMTMGVDDVVQPKELAELICRQQFVATGFEIVGS